MDHICGLLAGTGHPLMPPLGPRIVRPQPRRAASRSSGGESDEEDWHLVGTEHDDEEDDEISRRKRKKRRKRRISSQNRRRMKAGWRGKNAAMDVLGRVVAFVLVLALMITIFLLLIPRTTIDRTFPNVPVPTGPIRWLEVERICDQQNSTNCRVVADIIDLESNSAKRVIFFAGNGTITTDLLLNSADFESEVALIPPPGLDVHNSDTRLWPLDHGRLLNEYVAAMAILPFVLGALGAPTGGSNGRRPALLVVGLGGGTLDMFWHTRFPWLNITVYEQDPIVVELANKWFGTVDDASRRTILGGGIQAIEEAVKNGTHFDTIMVDACDSHPVQPCPSQQFLSTQTLQSIRHALAPMGAFVVNVLPLEEEQKIVQRIQRKLLAHFPVCVWTRMAMQMNNIFACLPYAIPSDGQAETLKMWNERMHEFLPGMGLQELLRDAKLSIGENSTN